MTKLLRAGLRRYLKSVILWLGLAASVICGVISGINTRSVGYADDIFILPFFLVLTVVIALMIGAEHGDGAIRSKVAAGYTKGAVYLSQLWLALAFATVVVILYLGTFIVSMIGISVNIPINALLLVLLGFWLLSLAYAAMLVTVSMLISQRAVSAVVCILLVMATVFATYTLDEVLGQPERICIETETSEGSFVIVDEPNPRYVGEPWRTALGTLKNGLPYGAMVQYIEIIYPFIWWAEEGTAIMTTEAWHTLTTLPLYSLAVGILSALVGWWGFRKKELK